VKQVMNVARSLSSWCQQPFQNFFDTTHYESAAIWNKSFELLIQLI